MADARPSADQSSEGVTTAGGPGASPALARLRDLQDDVWEPLMQGWRDNDRLKFWVTIVCVAMGGLVLAIGGGMEGPLQPPGHATEVGILTAKGAMVWSGGFLTMAGTVLLLFAQRHVGNAVDAGRTLGRLAEDHLHDRDRLIGEHGAALEERQALEAELQRVDRKRRERLQAIESMLEIVEAALLSRADARKTADFMLTRTISLIRTALDFRSDDFFTVTIFRREDRGDGERMYIIADQRTDPARAARHEHGWPKGKGYTGVAWARACDTPGTIVIVPDTGLPHVRTEFPVDMHDEDREKLYKSVAAIPILIGKSDQVWGCVTATFDRVDAFKRDASALGTQNVEILRDLARFAGLLAGFDGAGSPPAGRSIGR